MKHRIYFSHTDRSKHTPPLEVGLFVVHLDKPEDAFNAGYAYGKWLLENASGEWSKGLRRSIKDKPVMYEDADEQGQ